MTKQIIAVDVDDTILDENTAIRLFMNKTYGFNHIEEEYLVTGPYNGFWERIWQQEPDKMKNMYEEFLGSPEKANLKPIKGAINVLKSLKEKYELVVITSRDNNMVDMTDRSLAEHYPDIFSDIHFTSVWGNDNNATKATICDDIGAKFLIDDNFEHCSLVAEAGIQAILFGDYGWNRGQALPDRVTRCKDWQEVRKFFENLPIITD